MFNIKTLRRTVATLAVAALSTAAGAVPAHAAGAKSNCPASGCPDFRLAAQADATHVWMDTGRDVTAGRTITATGPIQLVASGADVTPDGVPNTRCGATHQPARGAAYTCPLPSAPLGALIGRINGGTPFLMGRTSSAPAAGRLSVTINEMPSARADDAGMFKGYFR